MTTHRLLTMISPSLLTALRDLLGTEVMYQGVRCRVLEVLDDGPLLVLEDCEENKTIQENQYGGLWRRVPQVYTIPVMTSGTCELHPQFVELNLSLPRH